MEMQNYFKKTSFYGKTQTDNSKNLHFGAIVSLRWIFEDEDSDEE